MQLLKRKIDGFLAQWKQNPERKPLIVKGARQIGKTESIRAFGKKNYESVIEINFVLQKKFRTIFDSGYEVDAIIKNISLLEPSWKFIPNKTLIFFDELQKCPDCATSLKSFNEDRRYDVICSGSLMGIYYEEIESNAVGNKEDFEMHSTLRSFFGQEGLLNHKLRTSILIWQALRPSRNWSFPPIWMFSGTI